MGAPIGVVLGSLALAFGTLEAGTFVRTEAAAGVAPVAPTDPPSGAAILVAEPRAALRLHEPTWDVVAGYGPRVFWRQPNVAELDRPLILHNGGLGHKARLDRVTTIYESLSLTRGELDYTGTRSIALTPGQTSQLDVAVLDYYDVSAEAGLERRLDRRRIFDLVVGGGESGAVNTEGLPTQRRVSAAPRLRMTLTRRDGLAIPVSAELHAFGDVHLVSPSVAVTWEHRWTRRTTFEVSGGARYAARFDDENEDSSVFPIARASARSTVYARGYQRANANVALSLTPNLDVIRALYRSVVGLDAGGDYRFASRWWVSAAATFFTPASATPLEPPEAETAFFLEAPVTYRPTRNISLFAGGRYGWRAPHFANGFHIEQTQVWAFIGATFREATGPDSAWLE